MTERDIDKLLGGYATGTLTDDERRRLFEAALHDQALFDALTHEDALKEVLDDPRHRRRLLEAMEAQQQASRRPFSDLLEWLRRPANLALAGTVATAVVAAWIFFAVERQGTMAPVSDELVVPRQDRAQEAEPRLAPPPPKEAFESPKSGMASRQAGPAGGRQPTARTPTQEPKQTVRVQKKAPRAAASASSKTSAAGSRQGGPLWLTSYRRPVAPGPARHLYYARLTPGPRPKAEEEVARDRARAFESMANVAEEMSRAERGPLGLRYSVLKSDDQGDFVETNPDGPFEADDELRVAVEVNEPGYLYVFRLGPRGEWLWISPASPLGKEEREVSVGVPRGKRYVIPGTGVLPLYDRPPANKLVLIYSREPRRELEVFDPAAREGQQGDDRPSADLESLLSRARIETSTLPLLVEQVRADQPEGPQERAVYIVNSEVGQDSAIVVELTLPSA